MYNNDIESLNQMLNSNIEITIHTVHNPPLFRTLCDIKQNHPNAADNFKLCIHEDLAEVVDALEQYPNVNIEHWHVGSWEFKERVNKAEYIDRLAALAPRIKEVEFNADSTTWPMLDLTPLRTFHTLHLKIDRVHLLQGGIVDLANIATTVQDNRRWCAMMSASPQRLLLEMSLNERIKELILQDIDYFDFISSRWSQVIPDLTRLLHTRPQFTLTLRSAALLNPSIIPFIRIIKRGAPGANIQLLQHGPPSTEQSICVSLITTRLLRHNIVLNTTNITSEKTEDELIQELGSLNRQLAIAWDV